MPVIKLKAGNSVPVSVDAEWLDATTFRLKLPDGRMCEGRLFSTDPRSGWLVLAEVQPTQPAGGKVLPYYATYREGIFTIWVDGEIVPVERVTQKPKRATDSSLAGAGFHTGEIKAPLPGRVLQVPVQVGDSVTQGTTLVVMESMKMETTLSAPVDGKVLACHCQPGDMADKGKVLMTLAPSSAEG